MGLFGWTKCKAPGCSAMLFAPMYDAKEHGAREDGPQWLAYLKERESWHNPDATDGSTRCPAHVALQRAEAERDRAVAALDEMRRSLRPEPFALALDLDAIMRRRVRASDAGSAPALVESALDVLPLCNELRRVAGLFERERAVRLDYERAVTFETSCVNCARLLDACRAQEERAERAEAAVRAADPRPVQPRRPPDTDEPLTRYAEAFRIVTDRGDGEAAVDVVSVAEWTALAAKAPANALPPRTLREVAVEAAEAWGVVEIVPPGRPTRAEMEAEEDALHGLAARQGAILTGVANALKGDPGPLKIHSHHDLAEVAADVAKALRAAEAATGGGRPRPDACGGCGGPWSNWPERCNVCGFPGQ